MGCETTFNLRVRRPNSALSEFKETFEATPSQDYFIMNECHQRRGRRRRILIKAGGPHWPVAVMRFKEKCRSLELKWLLGTDLVTNALLLRQGRLRLLERAKRQDAVVAIGPQHDFGRRGDRGEIVISDSASAIMRILPYTSGRVALVFGEAGCGDVLWR